MDSQNKARAEVFHWYGTFLISGLWHYGEQLVELGESVLDENNGLEYLKKAAQLGHGPAAYSLTFAYADVALEQCMSWLQKAAELGVVQAALELSGCYFLPPYSNRRLFMKWLKASARLGCEEAQHKLAFLQNRDSMTALGNRPASLKKQCGCCEAKLDADRVHQCCKTCTVVKYCSSECMVAHSDTHKGEECEMYCKANFYRERITLATTQCHASGCNEREESEAPFKNCSRCKHAVYCSPTCQKNHWKAGHREECAILAQKVTEARAVGNSC